ncbi:MAG TPA: formyltransferase family protein, partial [Moheibacter sp.]|nr:formyltransferase family protein [Moheibacter sp.]
MKVVFMGTPEFAAICLEEILQSNHEVVGVVTVPDKPAGRGQKITQSAVAQLAHKKNIPLLQPEKLRNPEFVESLKKLN